MAASERHVREAQFNDGIARVESLAGVPLLKATFAYGGELRLHFGEPVEYESAKLRGRTRGSWVLGLRATPWALTRDGTLLSRSFDEPEHVLRQFNEREGSQLTAARVRRADLALTLRFADDAWFMALTEPRRRRVAELWELLTPGGSFVVGWANRSITIEAGETQLRRPEQ